MRRWSLRNKLCNKMCIPERRRPEYKPKLKEDNYEMPIFEKHMFEGIPYIIIGDLPYAIDDKELITYELTRVLRDKLKKAEEELNQTENTGI